MSHEIFESIKSEIRLSDVISRDEKLESHGNGEYRGAHKACHDSKSGKCLYVNDNERYWFCFHCNEGGDVFKYVALRYRISNFEALLFLAKQYNLKVPLNSKQIEEMKIESDEIKLVRGILHECFKFYHDTMTQEHRNYYLSRGLTNETIDKYLLGYAKKGSLIKEFSKRYDLHTLAKTGLFFTTYQDTLNDRYDDRYVIPYWYHNEIVYSIGRTLDPNIESHKKYVKHLRHDKYPFVSEKAIRNVILGADRVKSEKQVLICEGIVDYLLLVQLGYNVISPVTIRFTKEDKDAIPYLVNHADNIYLVFDNESNQEGGKAATEIAISLCKKKIHSHICEIPKEESQNKRDIADFIKDSGDTAKQEVDKLLKSAKSIFTVLIDSIDTDDIQKKNEQVTEIAKLLSHMPRVYNNQYLKELKSKTKIGITELRKMQKEEKEKEGEGEFLTTEGYIGLFQEWGYSVKLNTCIDEIEINGHRLTDIQLDCLLAKVRDHGITSAIKSNVNHAKEALTVLGDRNKYHPIKDYLNGLNYDGNDYISELCSYFDCEQGNAWFKKCITHFMCGAVAKALSWYDVPVLTIDGKQNKGKSYFARWLCPNLLQEKHFHEGSINPDDKDCRLRQAYVWLWEVTELGATTSKADIESLKQFLTLRSVRDRKAYGRVDIEKPTLSCFIGTLNNDSGFLSDKTGNRRFLSMTVNNINWDYAKAIDVNKLWSQAVHIYKTSDSWKLTIEDIKKRDEINDSFQTVDSIEEFVLNRVKYTGQYTDTVKLPELLESIQHDTNINQRAQTMSISSVMRRLKAIKKREAINGIQITVYHGVTMVPRAATSQTTEEKESNDNESEFHFSFM